jgi:predicted  nucleic acid-binding Zn-ribbon protein
MADTSEIEKKSLEAHVELCAERYRFLENQLETMNLKITSLTDTIKEVHDMVHKISEKRNDQLLSWGLGLGAVLVSIIGYLISHYVVK